MYRYIHLKGIWDVPLVSLKLTRYCCIEISIHFIRRRPTSALRLILELEDSAGVKQSLQRSEIFRNCNVLHWNLDVSVHLAVFIILRLIHSALQVCQDLHQCYIDHQSSVFQNKPCSAFSRVQSI